MKIIFNKLNLKVLILLWLFFLVVLSGAAYVVGVGTYTEGYRVNTGAGAQNITVDSGGTCKKVTNASGKDLFIPTKTAAEWNAFVVNKPAGVTIESCSASGVWNCSIETHTVGGSCIGSCCATCPANSCCFGPSTACNINGSPCTIGTADVIYWGLCIKPIPLPAVPFAKETCSCCVPESDSSFCTRLGKNCGNVTDNDNCGTSRTVNCGTCDSGYTCSASNVCVSTTGTWVLLGINQVVPGGIPYCQYMIGNPCSPIGKTADCGYLDCPTPGDICAGKVICQ